MTIPMPNTYQKIVTINSSGRQTASLIRVASAVGWSVRAQIRNKVGFVAEELAALPNVDLIEGDLCQPPAQLRVFLDKLFQGANLAFINTTHWGDEVAIGKACADAAKRAGVSHYIYSSMPDHSQYDQDWKSLPLWKQKYEVEMYVREIGIPATFLITGIYNNNFTSLPYPVFQMRLQKDGSFVWEGPFHPDDPLPWLDAEHDVGPALLQTFKMGPSAWTGQRSVLPSNSIFTVEQSNACTYLHSHDRVILAFERLNPIQVCELFSRGVGRPVRYVHAPIKVEVPVPIGYRSHLAVLQETLGDKRAPYFGPKYEYPNEALSLWEGFRGIEEYAREVFPLEEAANGFTWMGVDEYEEDDEQNPQGLQGADQGATKSDRVDLLDEMDMKQYFSHGDDEEVPTLEMVMRTKANAQIQTQARVQAQAIAQAHAQAQAQALTQAAAAEEEGRVHQPVQAQGQGQGGDQKGIGDETAHGAPPIGAAHPEGEESFVGMC